MDSLLIVNFLHPYYTYQCNISAETIGPGPAANVNVTTRQEGIPNISPKSRSRKYVQLAFKSWKQLVYYIMELTVVYNLNHMQSN